MSSMDFNIDSLLDDLNDVVSLSPHRGSDYSTLKYVPHPPYVEKSQSQVFCTNPKSKFAVFPTASSSSSTGKPYSASNYSTSSSGDDSFGGRSGYRNDPKADQKSRSDYSSGSYRDVQVSNMSYSSPMAGNEKKNDNDNSLDSLLNLLSSPCKDGSPAHNKSQSAMFSPERIKESHTPGTFGVSCSLSAVHHDGESKSEVRYSDRRMTPVKQKGSEGGYGAICDDFDEEEEEESKAESRGWRNRGEDTKGLDSPSSSPSFKRVPTVQRLEDMITQQMNDTGPVSEDNNYSSSAVSKSSSNYTSPMRETNGTSSSGSDMSPKTGNTESFYRTHSGSSNHDGYTSPNGSRSMPAVKGGSPRTRVDEKDQDGDRGRDRIPGIGKLNASSSSYSSSGSSLSHGSSNRNDSPHSGVTKLPSAVPVPSLFSPSKSGSVSSSVGRGSSASTPAVGSASSSGTKSRCTRIVLAGASSARGVRSSVFSKCACDNLRCLNCNFKVHLFVGSSWSSGPAVDYMFFRNNTPNEAKLSAQLQSSPDQCAYCCQCAWTQTASERTLVQGASGDPQWICAGH